MSDMSIKSDELIFALDIGTRSIIGLVGVVVDERLKVIAIEKENHARRAMIDGQIEDIEQVTRVGRIVKERLEERLGCKLTRVCVAAAGRALRTQKAAYEMTLTETKHIDAEMISKLEGEAISAAEQLFNESLDSALRSRFYLVGHTVTEYQLDGYPISSLIDHQGRSLKAEVIATFLPSEVVESLYTTMQRLELDVWSLTLEPIAEINAAIPRDLRLLNLALVDIGAGTSDVAVSRDGGVVGYTMATVAGDEITEAIMKAFLMDFNTAERVKSQMGGTEPVTFSDVLGLEQTVTQEELDSAVEKARAELCRKISECIVDVNGGPASAIFLAGGGSKLVGMRQCISDASGIAMNRVAIAGNNFKQSAFSDEYDLNQPEYATPLGIAVSTGLNLIADSFHVDLNGKRAKLFRNGTFTVLEILMMNGYSYQDLMPRAGRSLMIRVNGERQTYYGIAGEPSVLRLNGADAKVSDIVHAGDDIEFIPAVHGTDASVTLADVLAYPDQMATVNGELADGDRRLDSGDVICTDTDGLPLPTKAPAPAESKARSLQGTPGQSGMAEKKPAVEYVFAPDAELVSIRLNDSVIKLSPKEDGEPYYVMDLIEHSGVDPNNPGGQLVLRLNGEDCGFINEVKPGDAVEIFCR